MGVYAMHALCLGAARRLHKCFPTSVARPWSSRSCLGELDTKSSSRVLYTLVWCRRALANPNVESTRKVAFRQRAALLIAWPSERIMIRNSLIQRPLQRCLPLPNPKATYLQTQTRSHRFSRLNSSMNSNKPSLKEMLDCQPSSERAF